MSLIETELPESEEEMCRFSSTQSLFGLDLPRPGELPARRWESEVPIILAFMVPVEGTASSGRRVLKFGRLAANQPPE